MTSRSGKHAKQQNYDENDTEFLHDVYLTECYRTDRRNAMSAAVTIDDRFIIFTRQQKCRQSK